MHHDPRDGAPVAVHHVHVGLYRRIAVTFFSLSLIALGLVSYVVFAHASVIVLAEPQVRMSDLIVDVARAPADGEVHGDVVDASDSLTQTFPTESTAKSDANAVGKVKISSTLPRSQKLIATTRLLSKDNVLYRINSTVIVPARGTVEVDAHADAPGLAGEVSSTTFTIPGLSPNLQHFFSATVSQPITGGVKEQKQVTDADIDQATEVLKDKLTQTISDKMKAAEGTAFAGQFFSADVVRRSTDVPSGTNADQFTLTVKLHVSGVFYDPAMFQNIVQSKVQELIPTGQKIVSIDGSATRLALEKADPSVGLANVRVHVKVTSAVDTSLPALERDKLAGITVDAAKTYLEHIDGVSSASIKVFPFWSSHLPSVVDHISVEVR